MDTRDFSKQKELNFDISAVIFNRTHHVSKYLEFKIFLLINK